MLYQQLSSSSVTLAVGTNTVNVTVPSGACSLGILVSGATTSAQAMGILAFSNQTLGLPKQYVQALVPTSGGVRYSTAFIDTVPGATTVEIDNQSANAITGTVTIIAFGYTSKQMKSNPTWVERFAWIGWSGSNINVFSTSPSNVNCILPITSPMMLLGMELDFSMAVGNDVTTVFAEVLSIVGFNRANDNFGSTGSQAFAVGGNAANPPTTDVAPGFGTVVNDTPVNWGPNTHPAKNTLAASITKGSDSSVAPGQCDHISLDMHDYPLPLNVGDAIWWHMAGQTTGSETTSQINAEIQSSIRYALL